MKRTVNLHLSEKPKTVTAVNLVPDIGLVEKRDADLCGVVKGAETHDIQPPPNTAETRFFSADGLNADCFAVLYKGNGLQTASILIASWKIRNQIKQRKDAELSQSLRPFLSDSTDISNITTINAAHALLGIANFVVRCSVILLKCVDQTLGTDDLVAFIDHNHFKAAVLPPVVEGPTLTQHKHRG